jgi:hypothetical protein
MSRTPTSEWTRPFVTAAAVILVVELAMVALGMGPQTLLVAALGAFLAATIWCLQALLDSVPPSDPAPPAIAPAPPAGFDQRVRTLRSGLVFSGGMEAYSERLHNTLIDLIDDQLAFAHGIDRQADPVRAASIIGPELDDFIRRPDAAATLSRRRDLDRIVTLIEQL